MQVTGWTRLAISITHWRLWGVAHTKMFGSYRRKSQRRRRRRREQCIRWTVFRPNRLCSLHQSERRVKSTTIQKRIRYLFWGCYKRLSHFCPPLSRKHGDIKSHSSACLSIPLSVRPSVCPSVTKTLTLAITFALLQVELWYLACVIFVTRPFRWYHVVTLTVTFDLLDLWPTWPLTYFKVKFVAKRGTTILCICLLEEI